MEQQDFLQEMEAKKTSTTLNVLTILTLIWCAYSLWGTFKIFNIEKAIPVAEAEIRKMADTPMPAFFRNFTVDTLTVLKLQAANKIPIIVLNVVGILLCIFGAIQMRSKKMMGYYLWLVGEILPIVGAAIFIGGVMFKGLFAIGLIFPILFIILYTIQRKNLTA